MYVYSQVVFQVVLAVLQLCFLIFAWVLLIFFSVIDNPATQIAVAFSSLFGIWETVYGEKKRKKIVEDGLAATATSSSLPNIDSSQPLMRNQSPIKDELPGVIEVNPLPTQNDRNYTQHNNQNTTYHNSKKSAKKHLALFFAVNLLLFKYLPIFINILFGYLGKPEAALKYSPLSEAADRVNDSSPNFHPSLFYSEIQDPLYDTTANFQSCDKFDDENAKSIFPLSNVSFPFVSQGLTFFQKNNVSCMIGDRFEEMVLNSGPLAHYNSYPSLPVMPFFKCKDLTNGVSMYYTESNFSNSKPDEYYPYPTNLKRVLDVGDNVTGISISPEDGQIYATTMYIDNTEFENYGVRGNDTALEDLVKLYFGNVLDAGSNINPANNWGQIAISGSVNVPKDFNEFVDYMRLQYSRKDGFTASYYYFNESASSNNIRKFTRTMLSYNDVGEFISVSKLDYRARQVAYAITRGPESPQPYFKVGRNPNSPVYLNAQVFPLLANVKVAPSVGGALMRATGYYCESVQNLQYGYIDGLRYNVNAVVALILALVGLTLLLLFLIYVVFRRKPRGTPFYYCLLHEYHFGGKNECYKSIFDINVPVYEGEGYVVEKQANHIGLVDEQTVKRPVLSGVVYR